MPGGGHPRRERRRDERPALFRDFEALAEQRLRGGGAEAHEDPRLDQRDLGFEPWPACRNLRSVRLRVDAPLAARLPLEVLHHVGDIDELPVDPGLLEGAVERLARTADTL